MQLRASLARGSASGPGQTVNAEAWAASINAKMRQSETCAATRCSDSWPGLHPVDSGHIRTAACCQATISASGHAATKALGVQRWGPACSTDRWEGNVHIAVRGSNPKAILDLTPAVPFSSRRVTAYSRLFHGLFKAGVARRRAGRLRGRWQTPSLAWACAGASRCESTRRTHRTE